MSHPKDRVMEASFPGAAALGFSAGLAISKCSL